MSPAAGVGTAFDGPAGPGPDTNGAATALLGAATPVTAGAHSIYLSLFDQGDNALDSAVFLDNMRTVGSEPGDRLQTGCGRAGPPDPDQGDRQHRWRDGPGHRLDPQRDRPDDDLGSHR